MGAFWWGFLWGTLPGLVVGVLLPFAFMAMMSEPIKEPERPRWVMREVEPTKSREREPAA
jgi:hypothetical protein